MSEHTRGMWSIEEEYEPASPPADNAASERAPPITADDQLGGIIGSLTTHIARLIGEREALRERVRQLETQLQHKDR